MENINKDRVYFVAGFTPRKGLFGAVAYLHELENKDMEFSRFYMTQNGKWGHREFPEDIVSVSYTKKGEEWTWWLLSKRGKVISSSQRGRFEEVIFNASTGSGKFGYLSEIKLIGDTLYACGVGRQIYKRVQGQWLSMDAGIRVNDTKYGFRSMDGVTENTIHAVGYHGEIWHFDGSRWQAVVSPTKETLESVHMISPNEFYACGKSGTIVHGFKNKWELVKSDVKENFWGLVYFKGKIYLSTINSLYSIKGDRVVPINLKGGIEGRKLYVNNDELWFMCHHKFWVFDGENWREVLCPDNEQKIES